jgi:hypothetical protein
VLECSCAERPRTAEEGLGFLDGVDAFRDIVLPLLRYLMGF